MAIRLAKYTVYIEEEFNDADNMDLSDALSRVPGYVEHEWDEWVD